MLLAQMYMTYGYPDGNLVGIDRDTMILRGFRCRNLDSLAGMVMRSKTSRTIRSRISWSTGVGWLTSGTIHNSILFRELRRKLPESACNHTLWNELAIYVMRDEICKGKRTTGQ
jgi:hypothetical protein